MKKLLLFILLACNVLIELKAQPWFPEDKQIFRKDVIPRVDISIHPDSLNWIYENVDSYHEFKVDFIYTVDGDSDTVLNVGFRLRGNTSRYAAKKSFKVSFNTFESGRKFKGLEKMNLNGEHNDPSIIRSYLGWNVCKDIKIPGARVNHVEFYINDEYFGLYANVEHIDEEFIEKRFDHNFGNLYKCLWPASLEYLGTNTQDYIDNGYELKINSDQPDYSDLINLTQIISNTSSGDLQTYLEPIFNVNAFLRYLAMEVFIGHWDAYSLNTNNYYLYNNKFTGKFEFIPYDLDNTFGVGWMYDYLASRNIYSWGSTNFNTLILSNETYRNRYSYFLNRLVETHETDTYFSEIESKKEQISTSANLDPFRPLDYDWSYADFLTSYTSALDDYHVHYGLKQFISERIANINNQLELNPIDPIIENIYHNFAALNEAIKIKADINDDQAGCAAKVFWKIGDGSYQSVSMTNDSLDVFSAILPSVTSEGTLYYYVEATDASDNNTRDPFSGSYEIIFGESAKQIVINEFMASNTQAIYDNYGETDDWIELKNKGTQALNLGDLFLSDDITDKSKWKLPNVTLAPGDFYLVWLDKDTEQGDNHANFKISADGEFIGLFDSFESNYAAIDTLTFSAVGSDISMGLNTQGSMGIQSFITPMGENESNELAYITFNYNMNKQIQDGNFVQNIDFIDIAGTFNSWNGSVLIYDGDDDGIHTATLFGYTANQAIEYKARMGAIWEGGEFYDLGEAGNRQFTVGSGANSVSHWFNDEPLEIDRYAANTEFSIYPNPVQSSGFTIESEADISEVSLFELSGKLVYKAIPAMGNQIRIEQMFQPGLYIIKLNYNKTVHCRKIIIH
ncbi:MAG: CotH kinase family protein [Salinivirgaceae bacterium]|nr:CotH kinase family protein [Salinivirgaceae bacterium]